ncbi:hypothetical protein [uncultured Thiohalocapsa sp.]|uniref:hypothetical protein n=1 Tax=uncultured Thiohalocapsa sp. TaxID=768990 RepID=UPI0025F93031|nr:hypothetical protein [uncultured Thiohalocapsa sp.]
MGLALKLYDQLDAAADDRARFRLIIEAIGQLEEGWPRPGEVARTTDVREAGLRLQIELGGVRKEIVQSKNALLIWLVSLMFRPGARHCRVGEAALSPS